jgi:hypothetical protein
MNKKSKIILYSFIALTALLCIEGFYIRLTKSIDSDSLRSKLAFVELSGLPDLAISTEATYVRHRSMSDIFSIYKDDGSLREYFPSTFVYTYSNIINKEMR